VSIVLDLVDSRKTVEVTVIILQLAQADMTVIKLKKSMNEGHRAVSFAGCMPDKAANNYLIDHVTVIPKNSL